MENGIGRIKTDEMRVQRIGVKSVLASCEASHLKAPMSSCCTHGFSGAFFFVSSVVVNRSPLHAHKERNALKAGPGASALPRGTDLLSSAPIRTVCGATALSLVHLPGILGKESGGKKKERLVLHLKRRPYATTLFYELF